MQTVLIVGASGILAPAAAQLAARGVHVAGIGRARPMPDAVEAVLVDARDPEALGAAIADRNWSHAVVYSPAVTEQTLALVRSVVVVRTVLVRTSGAIGPGCEFDALRPDTLQLGWHRNADGSTRWHTPEEVSAAALSVLKDGTPRVLGELQPWSHRP